MNIKIGLRGGRYRKAKDICMIVDIVNPVNWNDEEKELENIIGRFGNESIVKIDNDQIYFTNSNDSEVLTIEEFYRAIGMEYEANGFKLGDIVYCDAAGCEGYGVITGLKDDHDLILIESDEYGEQVTHSSYLYKIKNKRRKQMRQKTITKIAGEFEKLIGAAEGEITFTTKNYHVSYVLKDVAKSLPDLVQDSSKIGYATCDECVLESVRDGMNGKFCARCLDDFDDGRDMIVISQKR